LPQWRLLAPLQPATLIRRGMRWPVLTRINSRARERGLCGVACREFCNPISAPLNLIPAILWAAAERFDQILHANPPAPPPRGSHALSPTVAFAARLLPDLPRPSGFAPRNARNAPRASSWHRLALAVVTACRRLLLPPTGASFLTACRFLVERQAVPGGPAVWGLVGWAVHVERNTQNYLRRLGWKGRREVTWRISGESERVAGERAPCLCCLLCVLCGGRALPLRKLSDGGGNLPAAAVSSFVTPARAELAV
jgi:hypothetical protein